MINFRPTQKRCQGKKVSLQSQETVSTCICRSSNTPSLKYLPMLARVSVSARVWVPVEVRSGHWILEAGVVDISEMLSVEARILTLVLRTEQRGPALPSRPPLQQVSRAP